jgi:hypothetical protein
VAWLKREGVRIDGELPNGALGTLRNNKWACTKDEIPFWGEVDWAPDWNTIGPKEENPYRAHALKGREERKQRELQAEREAQQRQRDEEAAALAQERAAINTRQREQRAELKRVAEAERRRAEEAALPPMREALITRLRKRTADVQRIADAQRLEEAALKRARLNGPRRERYAQKKAAAVGRQGHLPAPTALPILPEAPLPSPELPGILFALTATPNGLVEPAMNIRSATMGTSRDAAAGTKNIPSPRLESPAFTGSSSPEFGVREWLRTFAIALLVLICLVVFGFTLWGILR